MQTPLPIQAPESHQVVKSSEYVPRLLSKGLNYAQGDLRDTVNAAHIAASLGEPRCLELALAYGHWGRGPETVCAASARGNLRCVKLLCEQANAIVTKDAFAAAVKNGHVACTRYLAPLVRMLYRALLCSDSKGLVPTFSARCVNSVCREVIGQGDLTAVETLAHAGCGKYMKSNCLVTACWGGRPEIVR
jgi:hypothetical protein